MQVTGGQPIPLRTYNQAYLAQVERWWADLLPRFTRHLFHNGGPVVMIQVARHSFCSGLADVYRASRTQ